MCVLFIHHMMAVGVSTDLTKAHPTYHCFHDVFRQCSLRSCIASPYANGNLCTGAGEDSSASIAVLGDKAKLQLQRDSRKAIQLTVTETQRVGINFTQVCSI